MSTDTNTLEDIDLESLISPYEEDNDPNKRSHIVSPPANTHIWQPGMTSQEMVDLARMTGQELVALCGHRWVPKLNPKGHDVCEPCSTEAMNVLGGI